MTPGRPGTRATSEAALNADTAPSASVDLFWLPLGAGDASRLVRWSGWAFEADRGPARLQHRRRRDLYHSRVRGGRDL